MFTSKKGDYSNGGITSDFYIIFSVLYFSVFLKLRHLAGPMAVGYQNLPK